jgi:hypothetical protein
MEMVKMFKQELEVKVSFLNKGWQGRSQVPQKRTPKGLFRDLV